MLKVTALILLLRWGLESDRFISSLPRKVLQMYSEIWLPDLDSEKWLSSLLSMRLNWKGRDESGEGERWFDYWKGYDYITIDLDPIIYLVKDGIMSAPVSFLIHS